MSKIALSPSPTGSAVYTIASPAGSTDRTLTLPDETATLFTNAGGTLTGGLTMGGQLNLGSTGQIVFPATQNASANANTLDDYEEGTWTASISGEVNMSGATWNSGSYTKIGNVVTVQGSLSCTITSSNTLTFVLLTLPFTSGAQTGVAFANNNIKVGVCDLDSSDGGRIIPFFPAASAIVSGSEVIQVAATYMTTT